MAFRRERHPDMNLNEVDYSITFQICQTFDIDRSWEQLAGVIGYKTRDIQTFELETRRPDGSPSKKLLWDWGTRGATLRDLYNKLNLMNKMHIAKLLEPIMKIGEKEQAMKEDNSSMVSKDDNLSMSTNASWSPAGSGKLPIPKKVKKSPQTLYSNMDVNLNTPDGRTVKPSKDKQKLLGLEAVGPTTPASMLETHVDGPASGPGNLGAAASSARSIERVKSVVDEYDSSNTLYMSQLSHSEQEIAKALIAIPHYTYKELSQATEGFSARYMIGEGKFGKVYRGRVKNTEYAIKKLFQKPNMAQDLDSTRQLAGELKSLSRYRHENIVSLYAYALDGDEICLVYQYMRNGSLEDCLHKNGSRQVLTWEQRLVILKGAACGLQFLHSLDPNSVIHGNIKSSNILLDKHLEARIGDLAMAQQATGGDGSGKFTHITKKNTGKKDYINMAYLAPEMVRGSGPSLKGDTFAFGVVVFECLTGKEAFDSRREGPIEEKNLNVYIDNYLADHPKCNKQKQLEDPRLDVQFPEPVFSMLFNMAENCTKEKKRDRPSMVEVYQCTESLEASHSDVEYSNFKGSNMRRSSDSPKVQDSSLKKQGSSDENITFGPPTKGNQMLSPVEYLPFENLPESVKLQLEVDKRNEKLKENNYVNVDKLRDVHDVFKSDPKKLAEIERIDAVFEPGSMSKPVEDAHNMVNSDMSKSVKTENQSVNKMNYENMPSSHFKLNDDKSVVNKTESNMQGDYKVQAGIGKSSGESKAEFHDYVNVPAVIDEYSKVGHELPKAKEDITQDKTQESIEDVPHEVQFDFHSEIEEIRCKAGKSSALMDIFNRYDYAKDEDLDDAEFEAQYQEFDINFSLDNKSDSDCSTLKQDEGESERMESFHLSNVCEDDLYMSGDASRLEGSENFDQNSQQNAYVACLPIDTKERNVDYENVYDQMGCSNGIMKHHETEMNSVLPACVGAVAVNGAKDFVNTLENRLNHVNLGGRDVDENEETCSLELDLGKDQSVESINTSLQKHRLKQVQYDEVLNNMRKKEGDILVDDLVARQLKENRDLGDQNRPCPLGPEVKGPPKVYCGLKVSTVGQIQSPRVPSESEYV